MDSVIRKFPIGIQNFESLINDGYVYVDKTALVYRMATTGRYYFLSRPRRFGKSLLLSTIEAYLSGKKELFKGLAIEKLEQKWEEHPIMHLSLNTKNRIACEDGWTVLFLIGSNFMVQGRWRPLCRCALKGL